MRPSSRPLVLLLSLALGIAAAVWVAPVARAASCTPAPLTVETATPAAVPD